MSDKGIKVTKICYECGEKIIGPYYTMEITKPYYEGEYAGMKVFLHKKCAEENYEKIG